MITSRVHRLSGFIALGLVSLASLSACGGEASSTPQDLMGLTVFEAQKKFEYTAQVVDLSEEVTGAPASEPDDLSDPQGWVFVAACSRDSDLSKGIATLGMIPVDDVTSAVRKDAEQGAFDRFLTCPQSN